MSQKANLKIEKTCAYYVGFFITDNTHAKFFLSTKNH